MSAITDKRWTGGQTDSSVGLVYLSDGRSYGRPYDPNLGRFIQPDPIVPQPGNPQDLNRYSYGRNSPMTYTDPSGHAVANPNEGGDCDLSGESCGGLLLMGKPYQWPDYLFTGNVIPNFNRETFWKDVEAAEFFGQRQWLGLKGSREELIGVMIGAYVGGVASAPLEDAVGIAVPPLARAIQGAGHGLRRRIGQAVGRLLGREAEISKAYHYTAAENAASGLHP